MRDVNDRVQYLERRMEDHAALMADIRSEMAALRVALESGFTRLDRKFERFDETFDGGFTRLEQKTDRHFMWLAAIVLTAFTAVFTAFIGLTYR